MTGKSVGVVGEKLSDLAVKAVLAVEENGKVDIDNIKVEKKTGARVEESVVINGIVLSKKKINANMPEQSGER